MSKTYEIKIPVVIDSIEIKASVKEDCAPVVSWKIESHCSKDHSSNIIFGEVAVPNKELMNDLLEIIDGFTRFDLTPQPRKF